MFSGVRTATEDQDGETNTKTTTISDTMLTREHDYYRRERRGASESRTRVLGVEGRSSIKLI